MQDKEFIDLLEKYTNGTASSQERAWLEDSYLNWNNDNRIVPDEALLTQAQEDIRARVMGATKPHPGTGLRLALIAAAVLLLVSSITWLFVDRLRSPDKFEIAAGSRDLLPGTDRATLVLANGQELDLTKVTSAELASGQTGLKITKSADAELTYELSEVKGAEAEAIRFNTIRTPAGGKYKVVLQDGTQVWLNASSSLTYPTSFTNAESRVVELKGEGYFEVAKLDRSTGNVPFVVRTATQEIQVLGTHFNVNAYPEEALTATTLLEGAVKINDQVILKPGQQGISKGETLSVKAVNAADYVDWKTGDFNLSNDDFRKMMRKISRWYDVEVIYDESAPEQVKLGGWISRSKNISSILNIMQKTGKVHFKLEGRRVTVSK